MLLNNYYIIRRAMDQQPTGTLNDYSASNNYFRNMSIDEILKLRLGSGNTISHLLNNTDTKISTSYSNLYNYSYLHDVGSLSYQRGDLAGNKIIGIKSTDPSYLYNNYLQSPTSTSWSQRSITGYYNLQTNTDFEPTMLVGYAYSSYYVMRTSDFIRVASGVQNDSTPVTLNDYSLTNVYDLNDIKISATAPCNGYMIITLYNNTNSEKTIREVGIYDCRMKCNVLYDDYTNNTTVAVPDLTAMQKQVIETSLADVTDLEIKYNQLGEDSGQQYGTISIPILVSKTKLTTPIVLQPNETKTITYEIKWN